MPGLERRLKAELSGEVQFDRFSRGRYATDASHYQIMPVGVVAPRTIEEAERAIGLARAEGVSVLARGGGTSQSGQAVGSSLVVDCSKYLTRILDLDIKGARCTVEPGIVLDDLNRQLKPHGLWFPVDISTSSRATIGGMAGNNSCGGRSMRYGTMRDNVLAIEAVLADGTLAHFGRIGGNLNDVPARAKPAKSPRASPRCSAASAATISTRWCQARTTSISPTCWSAPKARSAFPRASN
jgi:FAD/FMN-containing dehydrogenase